MSQIKVRVRGIYATALSFLLSQEFAIVDPSEVIQARLGMPAVSGPADVHIFDRPDRHGIVVEGVRSAVKEVVDFLGEAIPWAVFLPEEVRARAHSPLAKAATLLSQVTGEFPKPAKDLLDEVRRRVAPTLPGHHLLKTVDPARVDEAEKSSPQSFPELAQRLWEELVGPHYLPGKTVTIWHLKAGEPLIRQTGEVLVRTEEKLVLRRRFRPAGTYDGLGLQKEAGDYGLVEFFPERWWSRRLYFRADGTLLGELYNIQTPPEFVPEGVRYLDLEVDVIVSSAQVRIMDTEILAEKVGQKKIPEALARQALAEAQRIGEALAKMGRDEV